MNRVLVLSTAYFPNIEYCAYLLKYSQLLLEENESFLKQTYRNRCNILSSHGIFALTVPIKKKLNNNCPIQLVEPDYTYNWQHLHLHAIQSAYGKSPYFIHYFDDIEKIINKKYDSLLQLNTEILLWLIEMLRLKVIISSTNIYNKLYSENEYLDLRYQISPKKDSHLVFQPYIQTFSEKFTFQSNLSILDALFNLGPDTRNYLDIL